MHTCTPLLVALGIALVSPCGAGQDASAPQHQQTRELLADGGRVERQFLLDETGAVVDDGTYRSWHPDGSPAIVGQYEDGVRAGEWRTYYPGGAVESKGSYENGEPTGEWLFFYSNGQRRAAGAYQFGARNSRWHAWDAAGDSVPGESGEWLAEIEYHPGGRLAKVGEKLSDKPHGRWRWWSPEGRLLCEAHYSHGKRDGSWRSFWRYDGSPQLVGRYAGGERTGAWTFRHQDGSYDSRMLSGQFDAGRRLGNVSAPDSRRVHYGDPLPLSALPRPSPVPGTVTEDRVRVERRVDLLRGLAGDELAAGLDDLAQLRQEATPAILTALRYLDFQDPVDARFAELLHGLLTRIHTGHSLSWRSGASPDAAVHNRQQVLRLTSVWELTRPDPSFLSRLAESPPTAVPSEALLHPPLSDPAWIVDAAPGYALRVTPAARARRIEDFAGRGTGAAVLAATDWLARHQAEDGAWPAASGRPEHDVAVTGLVLLALVGAGSTHLEGPYAAQVDRARTWLLARQDSGGEFGGDGAQAQLLGHVLATTALAELVVASGDFDLGPPVRAALDRLRDRALPDGGWSGPSDAWPHDFELTLWACGALHAGKRAGLDLPDELARGGLALLTRATDAETGLVAAPGPEHEQVAALVLTAGSLFARFQLGQLPERVPLMRLAAALVAGEPPVATDPEAGGPIRAEHWFFGSAALFQVGGSEWKAWARTLRTDLPALQHPPAAGPELSGSWEGHGPWEEHGGRAATTALAALALESYYRLPRAPR